MQIEQRDEPSAGHKRHRDFGLHGADRLQIVRVLGDVAGENRFLAGGGLPGYAFADGNTEAPDQFLAVADCVPDAQVAVVGRQHDGEELIIHDLAHQNRKAAQQRVEIQGIAGGELRCLQQD